MPTSAPGNKPANSNEVWIVDTDIDDRELVENIFHEANLPYQLRFFDSGPGLFKYLKDQNSAPFIILCDVNIPGMDGFELREKLLAAGDRKFHSVPFIFWSNAASDRQVQQAYRLRAHGFFIKESTYEDWKATLLYIIEYWQRSKTPLRSAAPDEPLPAP